jgi:hypothetical protein
MELRDAEEQSVKSVKSVQLQFTLFDPRNARSTGIPRLTCVPEPLDPEVHWCWMSDNRVIDFQLLMPAWLIAAQ